MSCNFEFLFGVLNSGFTELIGIDEGVSNNRWSGSVGVALTRSQCSGFIDRLTLVARAASVVGGIGGTLLILSADPAVAFGASVVASSNAPNVIAALPIATTVWAIVGTSQFASLEVQIPFHSVDSLYFVFQNLTGVNFNTAGIDDDYLNFDIAYRYES